MLSFQISWNITYFQWLQGITTSPHFQDQTIISGYGTLISSSALHYSVRSEHEKYCHKIKVADKIKNRIFSL